MNMLSLAFYLSLLSYCLGLLLRALPLPFLSVKKISRTLVMDGIFSATLVFMYSTILRLVEYLGTILGSNWITFNIWLAERIAVLTSLLAVLRALGLALEKAGLGFIATNFLGPVTRLVVTCYITLLFILVLATLLIGGFKTLVAIGLALHAVPFRLTRSAGTTILAFTVVFTIGTPLMPTFISIVLGGVQPPFEYVEPICTANITLVDLGRSSLGPAVIEGYDPQTGILLYKYRFDERGSLIIVEELGFPCRDHVIRVDIAGNFYIATFRVNAKHVSRTYQVPNAVFLSPNRFLIMGSGINVTSITRLNKTVILQVNLNISSTVRIYAEREDEVEIYLDGGLLDSVNRTEADWYGIPYYVYTFSLNPGNYNLTVVLNFYKTSTLGFVIDPFILRAIRVDPFAPETLMFFAVYVFVDLVVLPVIYMTVLALISMNVAKLLGGYSSTIARFVVARL